MNAVFCHFTFVLWYTVKTQSILCHYAVANCRVATSVRVRNKYQILNEVVKLNNVEKNLEKLLELAKGMTDEEVEEVIAHVETLRTQRT